MKLNEFKSLLREEGGKHFRLQLPSGSAVPVSFHITEVARLQKNFIDCGGVTREAIACQLQVWVGEDFNHRIETDKAVKILDKARSILPDDSVPVEIEYEDDVISQYTIEGHESLADSVVLKLAHKHTDCLAKELCVVPSTGKPEEKSSCCAPGCCS